MRGRVVVLTGGIGGAKLALGLSHVVPGDRLTAIVNTGDDFTHLQLHISPDVDTLLYTLADLADRERGWGRQNESWAFLETLSALGGPSWFMLGDRDLALHVERTRRLAEGKALSDVTAELAAAFGIATRVVPMSETAIATMVDTDEGLLAFQQYFVARRAEPRLRGVRFEGAAAARPSPAALAALAGPELTAILIAPSNPWLSIDPILAVPGMRAAIRGAGVPVVAVTPVPGGRAVKGPTAKIIAELGLTVSSATIAEHYAGVIDAMLIDADDPAIALPHARCDTMMTTLDDRIRVACAALTLAHTL